MYILNEKKKSVKYLIREKKKWLSVLIVERKLPKIKMCHLSQNKLKRKM